MANSYKRGRVYIDTASSQVIATDRRIKVTYVLFVPDANNDQIILREASGEPIAFKLSGSAGKESLFLDFSRDPIVMNGVYVDSVSTNAVAILYTTTAGGS